MTKKLDTCIKISVHSSIIDYKKQLPLVDEFWENHLNDKSYFFTMETREIGQAIKELRQQQHMT
ncbi:MAG: hypothetical protein ACQ5SW_11540, partial [Sphaerochaetaceae bacterium]